MMAWAGALRRLLLAAALCAPSGLIGQERSIEVGLDGAVSYTLAETVDGVSSGSIQTWAFPLQRVRVGYLLTPRLELQATTGFAVADFGEVSTVRYTGSLAAVLSLGGGEPPFGPFVSAGGGLDLVSDNGTDVQWLVGAGFGLLKPMGDWFAFRPQIEVVRAFASDRRIAATTISAVVGFSVFPQMRW